MTAPMTTEARAERLTILATEDGARCARKGLTKRPRGKRDSLPGHTWRTNKTLGLFDRWLRGQRPVDDYTASDLQQAWNDAFDAEGEWDGGPSDAPPAGYR